MSDSSEAETVRSHVSTRPRRAKKVVPIEAHVSSPSKASLKVPSFSPDDPEIWFALLEGQFEIYGIHDDQARYAQVISNLDMVHAKAIKDLIVSPPSQDRYEKTKKELIRRLSASHEKKVRQLLTHEELGDRKPSQFLRHLQDLAGPSVPEDFVRSIWSSRLPQNLQTILASQPTIPLQQLADLADRVQEVTSSSSHNVATTSTCSCSSSSSRNEIAELRRMVERLELKLDQRSGQQTHRSNQRSRPRRRSRSGQRSRSNSSYQRYPVCWYHQKFGDQAQNCLKPCDYKAGNAKSSR